jgi:hypothetical protein
MDRMQSRETNQPFDRISRLKKCFQSDQRPQEVSPDGTPEIRPEPQPVGRHRQLSVNPRAGRLVN